jgi:hypothetical protein
MELVRKSGRDYGVYKINVSSMATLNRASTLLPQNLCGVSDMVDIDLEVAGRRMSFIARYDVPPIRTQHRYFGWTI